MVVQKHLATLTEPGKTRVQIDLSASSIEQINWLMRVCDLDNRKDLFNSALSLLSWATNEVIGGRVIASLDKESKHFTELSTPALGNAARCGQKERQQQIKAHAGALA